MVFDHTGSFHTHTPAAFLSTSALLVFSQVNSGRSRPKCPSQAVLQ